MFVILPAHLFVHQTLRFKPLEQLLGRNSLDGRRLEVFDVARDDIVRPHLRRTLGYEAVLEIGTTQGGRTLRVFRRHSHDLQKRQVLLDHFLRNLAAVILAQQVADNTVFPTQTL